MTISSPLATTTTMRRAGGSDQIQNSVYALYYASQKQIHLALIQYNTLISTCIYINIDFNLGWMGKKKYTCNFMDKKDIKGG